MSDQLDRKTTAAIKALAREEGIKLTEARRRYLEEHRDDYWLRQATFGTYTPTEKTVGKLRAENGYSFDEDISTRPVEFSIGTRPPAGRGNGEHAGCADP